MIPLLSGVWQDDFIHLPVLKHRLIDLFRMHESTRLLCSLVETVLSASRVCLGPGFVDLKEANSVFEQLCRMFPGSRGLHQRWYGYLGTYSVVDVWPSFPDCFPARCVLASQPDLHRCSKPNWNPKQRQEFAKGDRGRVFLAEDTAHGPQCVAEVLS